MFLALLPNWQAACRFLLLGGTVAFGLGAAADDSARTYAIPAQPVGAALKAYMDLSGVQVLYESRLAADIISSGVQGRFTAEAALATLLASTGLTAKRADVDAFIVTTADDRQRDGNAAGYPDIQFLTALQNGVLKVLCRDPRTRPGNYGLGIELWLDARGAVHRSGLIGSTGDRRRDESVRQALQTIAIGMPPPANTPQPFILSIAARSPRQTGDCGG